MMVQMSLLNYVNNEKAAKGVVDVLNSKRANAAILVKADVSDAAQAQTLLDKTLVAFGRMDIIVLNSGIMHLQTLSERLTNCTTTLISTQTPMVLFF